MGKSSIAIKYFVDIGMIIAFLLNVATGILKFPGLTSYFKEIYRLTTNHAMMAIHDWSGIVLVFLVLVHLILNFNWIVAVTKSIFKRKKKETEDLEK